MGRDGATDGGDMDQDNSSMVKSSQINGPSGVNEASDLRIRLKALFDEEKSRSWQCIFLMLALARHFPLYLILITFWMHIYQVGMSPFFGALGYLLLFGLMILGTNFAHRSLSNHNTASSQSRQA